MIVTLRKCGTLTPAAALAHKLSRAVFFRAPHGSLMVFRHSLQRDDRRKRKRLEVSVKTKQGSIASDKNVASSSQSRFDCLQKKTRHFKTHQLNFLNSTF